MTTVAIADLSELDQYAAVPFPPDYPTNLRSFFSPVDNVHGVLLDLMKSATSSLIVAMYGFDDDELADIIREKLASEHVFVQLTLDKSQSAGVHERQILAREDYPAASIAIGDSERGAIQHLKTVIVDGLYVVGGSTNLSTSGETRQDNELTVICDRVEAARRRARIDAIHAHMLATAKRGGRS